MKNKTKSDDDLLERCQEDFEKNSTWPCSASNISKSGLQFFEKLDFYFFLYHVDQSTKQL